MAACPTCNKQIKLERPATACPHCNTEVKYNCWSCRTEIIPWVTGDECPNCKYWFCPHCETCGEGCSLKAAAEEYRNAETSEQRAAAIAKMAQVLEIAPMRFCFRQNCHTYAKHDLPRYLQNIIRDADNKRVTKFTTRFHEVSEYVKTLGLNTIITVDDVKNKFGEEGFYGKEITEVLQQEVCVGRLRKSNINTYVRIEGTTCNKFSQVWQKEGYAKCPSCKRTFAFTQDFCDHCKYVKNTENNKAGAPYALKKVTSKNFVVCQMPEEGFKSFEDWKKEENKDAWDRSGGANESSAESTKPS